MGSLQTWRRPIGGRRGRRRLTAILRSREEGCGREVAILYFVIAGIIGILGSHKYGIERLVFKRELL